MGIKHQDPVCAMWITEDEAVASEVYSNNRYYFCADFCRREFLKKPEIYSNPEKLREFKKQKLPSAPAASSSIYTCPMHPEVIRIGSGNCPDCGMALEAKSISLHDTDEDRELSDYKKRLFRALPFLILLMALSMGGMFEGVRQSFFSLFFVYRWNATLQCLCALAVACFCWPILKLGFLSVVNRRLNMFTLISLGSLASFLLSFVDIARRLLTPYLETENHSHGALYFESAAMILVLTLLGQILEMRARRKTTDAIRALLSIIPKKVHVLEAGGLIVEKSWEYLKPGDIQVVRAGEKVAADGYVSGFDRVATADSYVDQSLLTGESTPILSKPGMIVFAGSLCLSGILLITTSQKSEDSLLSKIASMVSESIRKSTELQKQTDEWSRYFIPAVFACSLLTFVAWYVFTPYRGVTNTLLNAAVQAVSVLVIACPCALGLAAPMSMTVAAGEASRLGVYIKDLSGLERASKLTHFYFDKTGTLTQGTPEVASFVPASHMSAGDLQTVFEYTLALEKWSEHPFAKPLIRFCERELVKNMPALKTVIVKGFSSFPGLGVSGIIQNKTVKLGGARFLGFDGFSSGSAQLNSLVGIAIDGVFRGYFIVHDPLRDGAKELIRELKMSGVRVGILSGDDPTTVESVARLLDIEEFKGGLDPYQKQNYISNQRHQDSTAVIAMLGDGINDAPALSVADVSFGLSQGSALAQASAQIVLTSQSIGQLSRFLRLSKKAVKNVKINLGFAFLYNVLGIPIAAGVFYPFFGVLLNPMMAAFAMSLSSVMVIGNALRLKNSALS